MLRPIGYLAALLAVTGCTSLDYNAVPVGRFEGSALVVWVGPGDEDTSGDGKFLYVPRSGDELEFFRDASAEASTGNEVIRPGPFYTNGGSIPRFVQNIRGFNAWAFGPAYIIHDWLFVVRKCANDGDPDALSQPIARMEFRETGLIMAETIKTVSAQYDLAPETGQAGSIIAPVTLGPISRALWEQTGACPAQQVTPEHLAIVDEINGVGFDAIIVAPDDGPSTLETLAAPKPSYVIVGTIDFAGQ